MIVIEDLALGQKQLSSTEPDLFIIGPRILAESSVGGLECDPDGACRFKLQ